MKDEYSIEQLKKEFQTILSKFSHEIRNPIALISSEMQLIESTHPEVLTYHCWEDMTDHIDYIKELLNEFSDYNNSHRISFQILDPSIFLKSIADSIQPNMDYLGIQLKTDIAPDLPMISADPLKLKQALFNLLRNAQEAVKFPHGSILIKAIPIHNKICITIKDNGCGIPPEQLSNIFLPFVTFKPSGTGLGLSITKQIIEQHQGNIQVQSTLGQGTEFLIFLG